MDVAGLQLLAPGEVLFWSGAGISMDSPTNGPKGDTLTDRALQACFLPGTGELLDERYVALAKQPVPPGRPRLETVLDVVYQVHGAAALDDLLSDLAGPPPNPNHMFFAEHAARGGIHITANFDTCIERARLEFSVAPTHFHGQFDALGHADSLGARLSLIENGFSPELSDQLLSAVTSSDPRAIVFVGYSGSDYFDVRPFFEDHAADIFGGRTIVWLTFDTSKEAISRTLHATSPDYLRLAQRAGAADTVEITGKLIDLESELARAWGLSFFARFNGALPQPPWLSRISPDIELQTTASISLLARMGVRADAVRLARGRKLSTDENVFVADAWWGIGRYRRALFHWRRGLSPKGYAFAERRAAVDWIRGRYLRAERRLWALLVRMGGEDSEDLIRMRTKVAETYARVAKQMTYLPDVRSRVRPARVREVERLLEASRAAADPLGVQFAAKVASALDDLRGDIPEGSFQSQSTMFEQSESLHGMLNHRQAALRNEVALASAAGSAFPPASDFTELVRQNLVLGARGDAIRVLLIPTSERAFSPWEFLKLAWRVDYTLWHRARLFGEFTMRWARSRRRR
jgi:hypothetical protein